MPFTHLSIVFISFKLEVLLPTYASRAVSCFGHAVDQTLIDYYPVNRHLEDFLVYVVGPGGKHDLWKS